MARLDLVSNNNQERDSKIEEDNLWERSEDVTPCPSSGAIFYERPHAGGDLAREVAEDKTHHNSIPPLVPSRHHSASPVKGGKDSKKGVNWDGIIIREHLFNSGMCSGRR